MVDLIWTNKSQISGADRMVNFRFFPESTFYQESVGSKALDFPSDERELHLGQPISWYQMENDYKIQVELLNSLSPPQKKNEKIFHWKVMKSF